MEEELIKKLQYFGLTIGESKVYLAILKIGESKVGLIVRESKVSTSKIYDILKRLIEKGLILEVIKNNQKYFQSLSPNRLYDYLENKKEELRNKKKILEDIFPKLKAITLEDKQEGRIEVFEKVSGLKTLSEMILDKLEEKDFFYIIGAGQNYLKYTKGFFDFWQKKRILKKINFLGIYTKENLEISKTRENLEFAQIKYLDEKFLSPTQIVITPYFIVNILIKPDIKCIVIYGENIAKSYKSYFESLWKISKK